MFPANIIADMGISWILKIYNYDLCTSNNTNFE